MSIPSMDGALSGHGRRGAPSSVRYMTFGFRAVVGPGGNLDAAYDLLAAQVAPGRPVRLVYQTDSGSLWYTIGYDAAIKQTLVADNKAMTAYCDFSVTWRIRPDWRLRFSQNSNGAWGAPEGNWGVSDGLLWGTPSIALSAGQTFFTLDNTGVAGADMPTLDDTGPVLSVVGPFGGQGTGASAFPSMSGGTSGSVIQGNVVAGGSGYVYAPIIHFTGGSPTRAAVAFPNVVGGAVVSIVVVDGGSYAGTPTMSFEGGGTIVIANTTALVPDATGTLVPTQVTLPYVGAGYSATLDCGAQRFTLNGAPFRPVKANYQRWWFAVVAGYVNACSIAGQGSGTNLVNGTLSVDFYKKRA